MNWPVCLIQLQDLLVANCSALFTYRVKNTLAQIPSHTGQRVLPWETIPECRNATHSALGQASVTEESTGGNLASVQPTQGGGSHTRIFSVLRESRESQGAEPLSSQSDSWKFKNGDSAKQTGCHSFIAKAFGALVLAEILRCSNQARGQ